MKFNLENNLKTIQSHHSKMNEVENIRLWNSIQSNLNISKKIKPTFTKTTNFLKKVIISSIIFGATAGTAIASNFAKPGDMLYPVDTAIETIQLILAPESSHEELQFQFALERVAEVHALLEEVTKLQKSISPNSTNIQYIDPVNTKITILKNHVSVTISNTDQELIANAIENAFNQINVIDLDNSNEKNLETVYEMITQLSNDLSLVSN